MGFYACLILVVLVWSICTTGVFSDLSKYNPPCYGRCCSNSEHEISSASNEMKLGLMMYDTYNNRGSCKMDYAVKTAPDGSTSCRRVRHNGSTAYVCKDDPSYPPGEGHTISDDEGEWCYMTFQGSTTEQDWKNNFQFSVEELPVLKPGKTEKENIFVHGGFYENWLGLGLAAVEKAQRMGCFSSTKKIHIIGHSLGGALADLTYLHIKSNYNDTQVKVTTFGQPGVIFYPPSSSDNSTTNELLWENDSKTAYVQGKVRQSSDIAYYWHDYIAEVPPGNGWHILSPSSRVYMCEVTLIEWESGPLSYLQSSSKTTAIVRMNNDDGSCEKAVAPIDGIAFDTTLSLLPMILFGGNVYQVETGIFSEDNHDIQWYLGLMQNSVNAQEYTPEAPAKQPNTEGDMLQQASKSVTSAVTPSMFDSFQSIRDETFARLNRLVEVIAR